MATMPRTAPHHPHHVYPLRPLQRLHIDAGMMPVKGVRNERYFLSIFDKETRSRWVLFAASKSDLPQRLLDKFAELRAAYPHFPLSEVFADNGTDVMPPYVQHQLRAHGIVLHPSAPGRPDMNPTAERCVGVLKEAADRLIHGGNMAAQWWPQAMEYFVEIADHLPFNSHGDTPFKLRTGGEADLSKFFGFGSIAYPVEPRSDSVGKRATPHRLVGVTKKGYLLAVLNDRGVPTSQIVHKADIQVDEKPLIQRADSHFLDESTHAVASARAAHEQIADAAPAATSTENHDSSASIANTLPPASGSTAPTPLASTSPAPPSSSPLPSPIASASPLPSPAPLHHPIPAGTIPITAPSVPQLQLPTQPPHDHEATIAAATPPPLEHVAAAQADNAPFQPTLPHQRRSARDRTPATRWAPGHVYSHAVQIVGDCKGKKNALKHVIKVATTQRDYETAVAAFHRANEQQQEDVHEDGDSICEPKTFREALAEPVWKEAIRTEAQSLKDLCCIENPGDDPPRDGDDILPIKWSFRAKFSSDGKFTKAKARACARGDLQTVQDGKDYSAPTARTSSSLSLIAVAAMKRLSLTKIDVSSAYLHAKLPSNSRIFLQARDPSTPILSNLVWRLRRSLYGLKEAGHLWHELVSETLEDLGFTRNRHVDPCIFRGGSATDPIFIALHVDDLLIAHKMHSPELERLAETLQRKFGITRELNPDTYKGMHLRYTPEGIILSLPHFIEKTAARWGLPKTSTHPSNQANMIQCSLDAIQMSREKDETAADQKLYQGLVGDLGYISTTARPEITYPVRWLQRHSNDPCPRHVSAAMSILRYLSCSPARGRCFRYGDNRIEAFADADWGTDGGRSTSGVLVMVAGAPVVARTIGQNQTALSTGAAELMAISDAAREVVEIKNTLAFLGVETKAPINIYNDNSSASLASQKFDCSGRFRHLGIRERFIMDCAQEGVVAVKQIRSADQAADILTKLITDRKHFTNMIKLIGLRDN